MKKKSSWKAYITIQNQRGKMLGKNTIVCNFYVEIYI